jgi:hypothetical protein
MIMRCVFECCKNANLRCHLFNYFYFFQFLGANTAQATWTRWENGITVSTVQVSKLKTFFSLSLTPVANKLECSSLASFRSLTDASLQVKPAPSRVKYLSSVRLLGMSLSLPKNIKLS